MAAGLLLPCCQIIIIFKEPPTCSVTRMSVLSKLFVSSRFTNTQMTSCRGGITKGQGLQDHSGRLDTERLPHCHCSCVHGPGQPIQSTATYSTTTYVGVYYPYHTYKTSSPWIHLTSEIKKMKEEQIYLCRSPPYLPLKKGHPPGAVALHLSPAFPGRQQPLLPPRDAPSLFQGLPLHVTFAMLLVQ